MFLPTSKVRTSSHAEASQQAYCSWAAGTLGKEVFLPTSKENKYCSESTSSDAEASQLAECSRLMGRLG